MKIKNGDNLHQPACRLIRSINFPAVADLDHCDDQLLILDLVEYAVDALAHPVALLRGELFAPGGPRVAGQCLDTLQNGSDIRLWKDAQILGDRALEDQPIVCHEP